MMLSLPAELEAAIENVLRELPASQWVSAAQSLSQRYRVEQSSLKPAKRLALATGRVAALGYLALILPATYAQLWGAMTATKSRAPTWKPTTLLDIGSGPGTALWAATAIWPSLQNLTAWEREAAFLELGKQLAAASPSPVVAASKWEQIRLEGFLPRDAPHFDLIILGHVLNELDTSVQSKVISWAWEHCDGLLLLVEPGTSATFPFVKAARQQLLALGARTLAPRVHDQMCPLVGDWCHFPQKVYRPEFQRRAKAAQAGWEESKFSYAAMARFGPDTKIWGRLLHQPHLHKAWADLIVSSQEGIVRERILKRDKAAYQQARDYNWGDMLDAPPSKDA